MEESLSVEAWFDQKLKFTKLFTGCGKFRKKTNVSCSHRKKKLVFYNLILFFLGNTPGW